MITFRSLPLPVASMLLMACGVPALAQQDGSTPVGIVDQPCPPAAIMPESARQLLEALFMEPRTLTPDDFSSLTQDKDFAAYNAANRAAAARDWAGLCRFRDANAAVAGSGMRPKVVFMGDSITENWLLGDPEFFGNDNVNRGISGQTTPQMLLRFRADVVALHPAAVHILAGTNDVAGNTGPSTVADFRNNIMSMVEIARANGIDVILGSIPPAASFNWQPAIDPVPRIRELNAWLEQYAAENALGYIDYFTPLAGINGELRAELGNDGVHPNRDGYAIMRRLVDAQLANLN
jgi:lysophospholipase L1-like esterase